MLSYAENNASTLYDFISLFLVTILPAYFSYVAIRSKKRQINWLVLWILLAVLKFFDPVLNFLLGWIPFYGIIRLAFFVSLYPNTLNLSAFFFMKFLLPLLDQHKDDIDRNLEELKVNGLLYAFNFGELFFVYLSQIIMNYYTKSIAQRDANQQNNKTDSDKQSSGSREERKSSWSVSRAFRIDQDDLDEMASNPTIKRLSENANNIEKRIDRSMTIDDNGKDSEWSAK